MELLLGHLVGTEVEVERLNDFGGIDPLAYF